MLRQTEWWVQNEPVTTHQTLVLMKTSFVFVFRGNLQDVLFKTKIFVLAIRLQDVLKTFWRRLQDVLPKGLQDVFKTSSSSRRLAKTSSRHPQDVPKTSLRHLKDVFPRRLQNVFKNFWRLPGRLGKISSRRFQDVSSSLNVLLNKSLRRIQHVSKT